MSSHGNFECPTLIVFVYKMIRGIINSRRVRKRIMFSVFSVVLFQTSCMDLGEVPEQIQGSQHRTIWVIATTTKDCANNFAATSHVFFTQFFCHLSWLFGPLAQLSPNMGNKLRILFWNGLAKMEFTQFDNISSYNVMLTPNRFKHTAIEKHETTQQPCSFFRRGETMKQQRLGTELSLAPQIFQWRRVTKFSSDTVWHMGLRGTHLAEVPLKPETIFVASGTQG